MLKPKNTIFSLFIIGSITILSLGFSKPNPSLHSSNPAGSDTIVHKYKGQFQMKNNCQSCHVKASLQETEDNRSLSIELMGRRGGIKKFTIPATLIADTTLFKNERFSMMQLPSGTIKGDLLSNGKSIAKILLREQK